VLELRHAFDLEGKLIDVAPPPLLAWLERLHEGMAGLVEVSRGVSIWRVVTTSDMAADHAHPQVDPLATVTQAVLASVGRRAHFLDLIEVVAELLSVSHIVSLAAHTVEFVGCRCPMVPAALADDSDDLHYRRLTFVLIAGALILTADVARRFYSGNVATIIFGYVVMRFAMVAQWLRAPSSHQEGRSVALRFALGNSAPGSALVHPHRDRQMARGTKGLAPTRGESRCDVVGQGLQRTYLLTTQLQGSRVGQDNGAQASALCPKGKDDDHPRPSVTE
jgi:hypothetical protein